MSLLFIAQRGGCRLSGGIFKCLGSVSSSYSSPLTYYHLRQLHNNNHENTTNKATQQKPSATGISMCEMNNHPDFRLRVAKQKFGASTKGNKQTMIIASNIKKAHFSTKRTLNYKNKVQERGLKIDILENRATSSDGTSSAAIVNDRLRMARKKMIEKMKSPIEIDEAETITEKPSSAQHIDIAQERHWMDMWKDVGNEITRLRGELRSETDEDIISDIKADIKGLRKRKAEFAKLLGMDV